MARPNPIDTLIRKKHGKKKTRQKSSLPLASQ